MAIDPEDHPFRLLIVGNFSGESSKKPVANRLAPIRIDRDSVEDLFQELGVSVNLDGLPLSFREMEDFHPDRLYQHVLAFQDSSQLSNPAPVATGSLLDQMLADEPSLPRRVSASDANDMSAFLKRITAGHLAPKQDAASQTRAAQQQELASTIMRGVLHHPSFQAMEAAWRAILMLVRDLDETGLELYLVDLTLPELIEHMAPLQQKLKAKGQWSLLVGNYAFGQSELHIELLQRIAEMAQAVNAPFLAEAKLPGEEESDAPWQAFRKSPAAKWIGLALPRFLLRLPYGKKTSAIESFPFEEMPESKHSAYLWGNPAFLCASLLGQSFLANGWDMSPLKRQMEHLPHHVYQEDGQSESKPCAEILMTEREAYELMDQGFMPVASMKYQDAAMVVRFQSVALPLAPLPGFASAPHPSAAESDL